MDEISTDAAFIAEDPGEESDDRKRADDFVGEAGEGVGFLYVSSDWQGETAVSSSSAVAFGTRGRGRRRRRRGGGGNAEAEMEEGRGDLVEGSVDVGDNHHGCEKVEALWIISTSSLYTLSSPYQQVLFELENGFLMFFTKTN